MTPTTTTGGSGGTVTTGGGGTGGVSLTGNIDAASTAGSATGTPTQVRISGTGVEPGEFVIDRLEPNSGGYQVMSLSPLRKIDPDGVTFRSQRDLLQPVEAVVLYCCCTNALVVITGRGAGG